MRSGKKMSPAYLSDHHLIIPSDNIQILLYHPKDLDKTIEHTHTSPHLSLSTTRIRNKFSDWGGIDYAEELKKEQPFWQFAMAL